MGLSIREQGLSLLLALGVGCALGLGYDLLRPLRRRSRDGLWDLLFCAAAAVLCFLLAMREENGRLAGGQLLSSLAGLLLYIWLFSPTLAPIWEQIAARISMIWIFGANCSKKYRKLQKNSFKIHANDLLY